MPYRAFLRSLIGLATATLLVLQSAPAMAAAPAPVDTARTIYIGHSLINNDVPAIVQAMAESRGKTSRSAVQWYVGAPIQYNWEHCHSWQAPTWPPPAYACDEIDRGTDIGPYDAMIVTEGNNPIIYPPNPNYVGSTVDSYLQFLDLFLSRNPNGRPFFYTSWEDQGYPLYNGEDWTTHIAPELAKYEMIARMIEDGARQRGRSVSVPVIPVDLALRDVILAAEAGNFQGVTSRWQLFTDNVHLSPIGYYIAACVVYASVFQQSPAGATATVPGDWGAYRVNLDPALARRIQDFTWTLVSNYRGWTGAAVTTRPRAPSGLIVR